MSYISITFAKGGVSSRYGRTGRLKTSRKGGDVKVSFTRQHKGGFAAFDLYGDYEGCVLMDANGRVLSTINGQYLTVKTRPDE